MKKNCSVLILLLYVLLFFPQALQAKLKIKKPVSANWQIIAQSNLIIRGRLSPSNSNQLSSKSRESLFLTPLETLKGMNEKRIEVKHNGDLRDFREQFGNKEFIAFLVNISNERTKGFYLAESLKSSILPSSEKQLQLTRQEILNQKIINDNYSNLSVSKPEKLDIQVKQLLNGLVKSNTQEGSWKELLNLKSSAIPALIRSMDDKRTLPPSSNFNSFSHKSKGGYDDHFQYSPQTVQDAVSILLNQLTQISFYPTINGGTAEERKLDLSGWRVWLLYNQQ